jgi:glucokinase
MGPGGPTGRSLSLGVDIGATKVLCGLVDPRGRLVDCSDRRVHRNDGPANVVDAVLEEVKGFGPRAREIRAAGVAVAGQVDPKRGVVRYAPNLRWRDVPLGARFARALQVPVVLENDVRAATWGEWKHGAARGCPNLICIYVGTGVGGGLVSDGRLLSGAAHAAGEVGHMTLVAGGRRCSCPNRGCLEAYVSGWAIGARAKEAIRRAPRRGAALVRRAGSVRAVNATIVTAAARAGDPLATELMEATGDWLGAGAVGLVNTLNPARVLLGGGVIEGWPRIVRQVRNAVRTGAQPPAARSVRVGHAQLGPLASVVGAAWLARARPTVRSG